MACNIYKHRRTHGPCVQQSSGVHHCQCLQSFYWLYLFSSQRAENPISPAPSCWHCAWRRWWRFKAHRCYRHDLTFGRVYKHTHTHPELSHHYSSLTFDPDFTSQTKTRPPPFSLLLLFGTMYCAYNMQYATIIVSDSSTVHIDLVIACLLNAVELSLLFCYILRIHSKTQNTLLLNAGT